MVGSGKQDSLRGRQTILMLIGPHQHSRLFKYKGRWGGVHNCSSSSFPCLVPQFPMCLSHCFASIFFYISFSWVSPFFFPHKQDSLKTTACLILTMNSVIFLCYLKSLFHSLCVPLSPSANVQQFRNIHDKFLSQKKSPPRHDGQFLIICHV